MLINYYSIDVQMNIKIKDVIRDALIIGLSGALLWHFSNIWRYGQHIIQEPNKVILIVETAGLIVIFIYGRSRFIGGLKRVTQKGIKARIINMPSLKVTASAASVARNKGGERKRLLFRDN